MKTKFKLYIITILATLLISCNDYFTISTPPKADAFVSIKNFELTALGAYNSAFLLDGWNGIDWTNIYGYDVVLDFCTSDLARYVGNIHVFPHVINNDRLFSQPYMDKLDGPYLNAYRTIACCNSTLDYVNSMNGDPFPFANKTDNDLNVKRIIGELHFMRAYAYFFLVRTFHPPYNPGGDNSFRKLVLRKTMAASMDEALSPQRGTTQEIYDFIVSDLEKAKTLLPEHYTTGMNPGYQYGRANRYVAEAILARVYMMMGRMDEAAGIGNALENLNDIIDNGGYDLENEPFSCFNRGTDKYTLANKEIIWELFAANNPSRGGSTPAAMSHFSKCGMFRAGTSAGRGKENNMNAWMQYSLNNNYLKKKLNWITDVPQDEQLTDIAKNDKRYKQLYFFYYKYNAAVGGKDSMYLKSTCLAGCDKEQHSTIWIDKHYRALDARSQNTPIVRFAEILLHRAAILLKKGDKSGAARDLDRIAKRAWAGDLSQYNAITENNITEDRLTTEYIKELAGEGTWQIYLHSMRMPIPQGDHKDNYWFTEDHPELTILPPYSNQYWPIPASEDLFNK